MSPALNLKETIVEALTSLGGSGTVSEIMEFIKSKYGLEWRQIDSILNDLCPESQSSFFAPEDRVLIKTGKTQYALRGALVSDKEETGVTAESAAESSDKRIFSFRDAKELLQRRNQLSTILQAASLTSLESETDHEKVKQFFSENGWEVEAIKVPVSRFKLAAFKDGVGVQILNSTSEAIHGALFRAIWAYAKEQMGLLVFIIPASQKLGFEETKKDIQAFRETITIPVLLIESK